MEFEKIVSRPGYEELAKVSKEWLRVAARQKGKELKVPLPNYFLVADDGFDFEGLFLSMADFLEKIGLMEFESGRKLYTFFLKYSQPSDPRFDSFAMLYDAIEHQLNHFSHPYDGILVVDITEWVERDALTEAKFIDFLSYMDSIDDKTLAVFLDRSGVKSSSKAAFEKLDLAMRIESLHMSYKDAEAGLDELCGVLGQYGFCLEEGFRNQMKETVDMVLNTEGSQGVESIRQLALDMVYSALKSEEDVGVTLTAENSALFLPDGEWARIFKRKRANHVRLGLVGEED